MALHRLTNDRWSYSSNCFVCEASNAHGLRIPFHHDDVARVVVADFNLDDRYSGAPTLVHGGISLAIVDEAMAWAAIAIAGKWAVTVETRTSFPAPVRTGVDHRVTAAIASVEGDHIHTTATIHDADGTVCTDSAAEFLAVSEALLVKQTGQAPTDAETSLLADDR